MADPDDATLASLAGQSGERGSNQSGMRAHNERLVLTLLRRHGAQPKAEIARRTGLSAQTVSVIMRALEEEGLIAKGAPVRGRVGQPSVPMHLAPDGAFFLGLKIGRRSLELVLIDFVGEVRGRAMSIHRYPQPEPTLAFVTRAVPDLIGRLPAQARGRIGGLGIGIPFFLWDWADPLGIPPQEMAIWQGRDLQSEFAALFDFPIYLENDASAACNAEIVFGARDAQAEALREFVYAYIGYSRAAVSS